ncbi:hypothetical protein PPERSA_12787 [Pseudocohnilembus persalinus]|uniref:Acyltransferase n=1 Tax=Pseudocohnilembus persalinus TaxID=266149 RepID=A0A0V0QEI7_PSEPJ|nr:hypothetical protein PPERSA_12787 [Pseudocohnilembus persalinus]|eukprot:KRX00568.1 hypothetical protein PPERSA_12787 [Pseudocohnilembus persalinus]
METNNNIHPQDPTTNQEKLILSQQKIQEKIQEIKQQQQTNLDNNNNCENNLSSIAISRKDKIKGIIAMIFIVYGIHLLFVPVVYIIWTKIIVEQNPYYLAMFIIQQVYQFKFCKKQNWFLDLGLIQCAQKYFSNFSVIKEEEIPKKKALIGCHPHGVIAFGVQLNTIDQLQIKAYLASRVILSMPISGMILRWAGIESVDAQNMKSHFKQGNSVAFLPGGFEEATLTSYNEPRVFIKSRKGFVKYALQYGYKVFPMYIFGENKLYYTFDYFLNFRMFLNKLKIPGILFLSKLGLMPDNNIHLHPVIGKGIQFPQIENPSKQQIAEYHQIYINELQNLYNRYKQKFNETQDLAVY